MDALTTDQLNELLAKAKAATEGKWQQGGNYWNTAVVTKEGHSFVAGCGEHIMSERDASFIVASQPSTIIKLVEMVKELQARFDVQVRARQSDHVDFERIAEALGTSFCCGAETMKLVEVAQRAGAELQQLREQLEKK